MRVHVRECVCIGERSYVSECVRIEYIGECVWRCFQGILYLYIYIVVNLRWMRACVYIRVFAGCVVVMVVVRDDVHARMSPCEHTHAHTRAHTHAHTHAHTLMHTHTHAHTCT